MDLSIIIVNFNTRDFLKNCLKSIFDQAGKFEVWVVDNASSDGSVEMVEREFPQVKLIKNKENTGFAKANNLALKMANGQFVFLLNSDTILKEQTLNKIINFLRNKSEAGAIGVKLLNADGKTQPSAGKFYSIFNALIMLVGGERFGLLRSSPLRISEVDWVSGAALIVRKDILDKVGLLDENFFMYMEEVEWCFRIKKAGFKIFFYPDAEVIHYERGSSSKSVSIWGIYKGLAYFFKKHKPPWQVFILKAMLKTKAAIAWIAGVVSGNQYLKATYSKAFHLI